MLQTDLLPAQLQFLLNSKQAKVYKIFGTILKELTFKKVIYFHNVNSLPNQQSRKTQKYGMVMQAANFHEYFQDTPIFFEKVFLSPLEEIPRVQLRILTDYVTKRYNMPTQFVQVEILGSLIKAGYMSAPPVLKSFGVFSPTATGKEETQKIIEYMNEVHSKISSSINESDDKFIASLEETGIYALFLEFTDHELYEKMYERTEELVKKIQPSYDQFLGIFHSAMIIEVGAHLEDH